MRKFTNHKSSITNKKTAYFDCFSGASGDMILGALLDAGLSLERLKGELAKLHLPHFRLDAEKVNKKGIAGSRAIVEVEAEDSHRHLSDVRFIIEASALSKQVKARSNDIFTRLAQAEARVHGIGIEAVHFHEVGAVDAIVDVVGAVAGLDAMGVAAIYCSALNVGTGTIECAHGLLPVPAPATAELIRGRPVYATGVQGELLTPTGAAILTTLARGFGPMPAMTPETVGYGAGSSDFPIPNMLRVTIGESADPATGLEIEPVAVIETSIDDMNPQIYDHLIDRLLKKGVMDVFLVPLQMKKNRPGTLLTVLCRPEVVGQVADFLLAETTTIGLRWRIDNRLKVAREIKTMETPHGVIRFKVAENASGIVNVSPEYDDCKRVANDKKIPLKTVLGDAWSVAAEYTRD